MRYFITTFGCQMNESDTVLLGSMLQEVGHQETLDINTADLIVVNTCCIRQSAENKILGYLGNLKHYKQAIIAVCGCMMQKDGIVEKLLKSYRNIDIILGTFSTAKLPMYVEQFAATSQKIIDVAEEYAEGDLANTNVHELKIQQGQRGHSAQVSIIYGCNNYCSYCIVPYVRGRERSRQPELIMRDIRQLAKNGIKEVQLLGQNVNSYGHDLKEKMDFADLLTQVNRVEGLKRIRYMTSHPRDFSDKLIKTIASLDKVCQHFHLPLQAGSNKILSLMNRGYTREEYFDLVNKIRIFCPHSTITTDIIVGFPNETAADFADTMEMVEKIKFDMAYTFVYSPRSGTPAAQISDQVTIVEKKMRLQSLQELQNSFSLQSNTKLLGQMVTVMVEGPSKNNPNVFSGRTDGNKIVLFKPLCAPKITARGYFRPGNN
jgi:tRNA-2-methylthio-N6-dimethylallyladenosine synthase